MLQVNNLHTYFPTKEGVVKAVSGVSFELEENGILGIVGESGSGKTVTALSIMRLVPFPGEIVAGSVLYNGKDLLSLSGEEMRRIRGKEISLVFQDAASALNPVLSIGKQVEEMMLEHTSVGRRHARALAIDLLSQMGIPDAKDMLNRYPFQLSGGMAQRVMMAIGVALKPRVLIADEPTSNLDVTLQAEMLQRLRLLRQENKTGIILITHDMGIIAQMAENVAVMYGGRVVEFAETRALFRRPMHPYTWGLFQSLPRLDSPTRRLTPMSGAPPQMIDAPNQCPFLHRCSKAVNACRTQPMPQLVEAEREHKLACYNPMAIEETSNEAV